MVNLLLKKSNVPSLVEKNLSTLNSGYEKTGDIKGMSLWKGLSISSQEVTLGGFEDMRRISKRCSQYLDGLGHSGPTSRHVRSEREWDP